MQGLATQSQPIPLRARHPVLAEGLLSWRGVLGVVSIPVLWLRVPCVRPSGSLRPGALVPAIGCEYSPRGYGAGEASERSGSSFWFDGLAGRGKERDYQRSRHGGIGTEDSPVRCHIQTPEKGSWVQESP
jgi:hypothetical protein